jgi:hypothetical protein
MSDTTQRPSPSGPSGARSPRSARTGEAPGRARRSWLLPAVRYVLPGAVVLAGIVFMAIGSTTDLEGGAGLVGAGLAIYLVNLLLRAGTSGEREREAEDAAREYFDRHGRWPE